MEFEWDEEKARTNVVKHDVTFQEAEQVFYDMLSRTSDAPNHSDEQDRLIVIGMTFANVCSMSHSQSLPQTAFASSHARRPNRSVNFMKIDPAADLTDELRPEYTGADLEKQCARQIC